MTQIPVFIQAVPWEQDRVKNAVALARETGAVIVWDRNHSPLDTYLEVLRAMGDSAGILLEDDVVLAPQWRDRIEAVIAEHPGDVIRFWCKERQFGSLWLEGRDFYGNLCVYFPAGVAADFLAYVQTVKRDEFYHDLQFGRFLAKRKRRFLSYEPSLVQHMTWESVVKSKRRRNRVSPSFGRSS